MERARILQRPFAQALQAQQFLQLRSPVEHLRLFLSCLYFLIFLYLLCIFFPFHLYLANFWVISSIQIGLINPIIILVVLDSNFVIYQFPLSAVWFESYNLHAGVRFPRYIYFKKR